MGNIKHTRKTNFELLRIISMIMIITLHILGHGGLLRSFSPSSAKYYILWSLEGICYISVNCFVLISGYFNIESKFSLRKIFILLLQVIFYSLIIYLILCLAGLVQFSALGLFYSLTPFTSGNYWFATMYIAMYLLSPFINKLLNTMNQIQHLKLIFVTFLLFSAIPTLAFYSNTFNFGGGYGVVWFIVLYIIAGYIKKYPISLHKKHYIAYLFFAFSVPLSKFVIVGLSKTSIVNRIPADRLLARSDIFYKYNSIPVLVASIIFFIIFLNIEIKNNFFNKVILFFAPLTFGVYLIHDNPFLRPILWQFINIGKYTNSPLFFLILFGVILVLFIIFSLIEYMRFLLFNPVTSSTFLIDKCYTIELQLDKILKDISIRNIKQ